ncbi:MAG: sulfotransferase family protein [Planctomycetota bacterium]
MTTAAWYESARRATELIRQLDVFFVVGCQWSGTTWVGRLLDAHPHVACRGEGHLTDVLTPMLELAINGYNDQDETTHKLTVEDLFCAVRLLADRMLAGYVEASGCERVVAVGDKTPEAAVAVPQLGRLYPEARFVHVIRDGRDGAVSGWAHLQRQGQADRFAAFEDYAAYFAEHHWKPYVERARAAGASLPGRYMEVHYESLLTEPRATTAELLRFLGVESDDATVDTCVSGASFERLSGGRPRGEEDATSHFRKGVAGEWVEHFSEQARRRFADAAGDLLDALGYGADGAGLAPPCAVEDDHTAAASVGSPTP